LFLYKDYATPDFLAIKGDSHVGGTPPSMKKAFFRGECIIERGTMNWRINDGKK